MCLSAKGAFVFITSPLKMIETMHINCWVRFISEQIWCPTTMVSVYFNPLAQHTSPFTLTSIPAEDHHRFNQLIRQFYTSATANRPSFNVKCSFVNLYEPPPAENISNALDYEKTEWFFTDMNGSVEKNRSILSKHFQCLPKNIIPLPPHSPSPTPIDTKFRCTVVGGTFDRLHNGHRFLLWEAMNFAEKRLLVGVSSREFLESMQKFLSEVIEPIEVRIDNVRRFLESVSSKGIDVEIEPLHNQFGSSVSCSDVDCIVVSEETTAGAIAVNEERKRRGLKELEIRVVPVLLNNDGKAMCSTNLRAMSAEYLWLIISGRGTNV